MPNCVALVPARSGSKRLVGKNVRLLNSHPLMAYTIAAAIESGVFGEGLGAAVYVSTDSNLYADIARAYGAQVIMRPAKYAGDTSPDIEWVRHALEYIRSGGLLEGLEYSEEAKARARGNGGTDFDCFSILRPTSPFRQASTIQRAWNRWLEKGDRHDSMRAVEPCSQHPFKMWEYEPSSSSLSPLMASAPGWYDGTAPGHSRQYASLPPIYAQNASLEIAWTRTVFEKGSISGDAVLPFFTEGHEGMDVNRPQDWDAIEVILSKQEATLPQAVRVHDPLAPYRTRDGDVSHIDKAWVSHEKAELRYLGTEGTDAMRKRTEEERGI